MDFHPLEKFKMQNSSIKDNTALLTIKPKVFSVLPYHARQLGILEHYQNLILLYKPNANFATWGEPDKYKPNFFNPLWDGFLSGFSNEHPDYKVRLSPPMVESMYYNTCKGFWTQISIQEWLNEQWADNRNYESI